MEAERMVYSTIDSEAGFRMCKSKILEDENFKKRLLDVRAQLTRICVGVGSFRRSLGDTGAQLFG
jgi:hypothetical protein